MDKKEIESIVKDTLEFVKEEFFETTAGEKRDLAEFLRNCLAEHSAQPTVLCTCKLPGFDASIPAICPICKKAAQGSTKRAGTQRKDGLS